MKEDSKPNLYSIGTLASILKVSASTLRYYDVQGILTPEIRDPDNNYRYYSENQVLEAINIIQLKRMGLSLQSIKQVLERKRFKDLKAELEEKMNSLESDIKALESQYQYTAYSYRQLCSSADIVDEILLEKNPELSEYVSDTGKEFIKEFDVHYVEKTSTVFTRFINNFYISKKEIEASMELQDYVTKNDITLAGPLTIRFFDTDRVRFLGGQYEVELLYPIAPTSKRSDKIGSFGGFWTCSTLHLGKYEELPEVFERLEEYIASKGLFICGEPYEEYLIDHMYLNNRERFLTRVSYPVNRPERK